MKLLIDTTDAKLIEQIDGRQRVLDLYSKEAFEAISDHWIKMGWAQKYSYTFTWMGRPIIQLPEDLLRVQEVIYQVKPDVIIETGVAHGGSLVYYATLCKALGRGRVIGIDREIRPHNRRSIESHELFELITLIEGDSTDPEVVRQVRSLVAPDEATLVLLDSCHTKEHVRRELEAYHSLVTPESYIVAADGVMKFVADTPRGKPEWARDNPAAAATEFAAAHPEFSLKQPGWSFNESELTENVTCWPSGWLQRR